MFWLKHSSWFLTGRPPGTESWFADHPRGFTNVDPLETSCKKPKHVDQLKLDFPVGFGGLKTSFPLNRHNLIHRPHPSSIVLYYFFNCPLSLSSVKHNANHNTFKTGQYWGQSIHPHSIFQPHTHTHVHDSQGKNMSWQQHSWELRDGAKQGMKRHWKK